MALNTTDPNSNLKSVRRRGSGGSYGVSNAGGSTVSDVDTRKRKLKNNMIKSFTERIFGFTHISNFITAIDKIYVLGDMDYHFKEIILNIRFYSFAVINKDTDFMNTQKSKLQEQLDYVNEYYLPILKPYSNTEKSKTPVILFTNDITNGNFESSYEYYNSFTLLNTLNLWINELVDTSPEEWIQKVDDGENILWDFRFKMFSDNSEGHFDDVICESIDLLYEDEITNKNKEVYILYGLTIGVVFLSLLINFLGSINDLVSKFEIGIESITETYDISIDNKKNDISKIDDESSFTHIYNKLKGYIVNILLLGLILSISIPIIVRL
ncbi:hypothetical protein PIROE2DRAFT_4564 [Piromyces sp. E2]|nr:hypothetical protein PIROE2DRAFT_4564 [Piromyces sp. E2]|eukprot:OUM67885.1 hypothetical protein PIROE2DRAFT_4564 [Piromyces sp. E2]